MKRKRVLLSCLQSLKPHPLPSYSYWRSYFTNALEEGGVEFLEVPQIDWAEGLIYPSGSALEGWKERTWKAVLDFTRREHARRAIDFFLCYLYPKQVDASAINELSGI